MTENAPREHDAAWYEDWFDLDYQRLYQHRNRAAAEPEVGFAVDVLQLRPHERIHDLCAGNGRHLVHLLARGFTRAFGSDLSPAQLAVARRRCLETAGHVPLVRADMRSVIARELDAVLSFFTSFGYFADDDDNARVLTATATSLRVGGRLLLDVANRPAVIADLEPRTERDHDGGRVVEERRYDPATRRVEKTITLHGPDGTRVRRESVRLYDRDELGAMLEHAGLRVDGVYGDFDRRPHDDASPRMILVARRG